MDGTLLRMSSPILIVGSSVWNGEGTSHLNSSMIRSDLESKGVYILFLPLLPWAQNPKDVPTLLNYVRLCTLYTLTDHVSFINY